MIYGNLVGLCVSIVSFIILAYCICWYNNHAGRGCSGDLALFVGIISLGVGIISLAGFLRGFDWDLIGQSMKNWWETSV